jgi:hypothetical protein
LKSGRFREEPLQIAGWVGAEMVPVTPPRPDEMDCFVVGDKLWPVDEADQALARKAMRRR